MWLCSQIGAREHYAIPRALHRNGQLGALFTDFWAGTGLRKAATVSGKLSSLAGRFHPGLADAQVSSWNVRSVFWSKPGKDAFHRVRNSFPKIWGRGGTRPYQVERGPYFGFVEVGRRFAICVREALRRRTDLGPKTVFFGYDTGCLETLEFLRERGVFCIVDQMDPAAVEVELVQEEQKRWPGWESQGLEVPTEYSSRRQQEWALANRVVVNSEFCRRALVQQGVPAEKLAVVPLCYEAARDNETTRLQDYKTMVSGPVVRSPVVSGPIRVLWLGQVILRKGIQYLIEAARQLAGENVRFDIVGPIAISRDAVASAPANVTFHGRVSRDQAGGWYRQSHLFVLPTISDGFALTQLEAMAHGLPVITTPNCGEVVTDGVDGFIIPPREPVALARVIAKFNAEGGLLQGMSANALKKVRLFSLERLYENLQRLAEVRS